MIALTEPQIDADRDLQRDIALVCDRIAPTWPLDRFIAVNPCWGFVDMPLPDVAAELGALAGAKLLAPRAAFREHWRSGRLRREHLQAAITAASAKCTADDLIQSMQVETPPTSRLPLLTDLADAVRLPRQPQRWRELVTHQISQHAAAYFDRAQAAWGLDRSDGLYGSWRRQIAADRGLPVRAGHAHLARRVQALPATPTALIGAAVEALGVPPSIRVTYLLALLSSVQGWASWCAYRRWQARLAGDDDEQLVHLLATRVAFEWLLLEDHALHEQLPAWIAQMAQHPAAKARVHAAQEPDWLLQHALEIAGQQILRDGLQAHGAARPTPLNEAALPAVQAVFCIDVRSERLRRHLEAVAGEAVQTRGFAGFFGLPIAYAPLGSAAARPQLPGLLSPSRTATQVVGVAAPTGGRRQTETATAQRRRRALAWQERWNRFRAASSSAFTFVEACGLLYAAKLVRDNLPSTTPPTRAEDAGLRQNDRAHLRPVLPAEADSPQPDSRVDLARSVLQSMGLRRGFARLLLLVGHGSCSTNNPHAAGLDCGACGGQTGEVNARVLADLLNDPAVRRGLRARDVDLPDSTHVVAGLHNTTTDEVTLFDLDLLPPSHAEDRRQLQQWLAKAGERTRAERAPDLGLDDLRTQPDQLLRAMRRRASDWAQVRPEWGLADNAAFVVAPRQRTRHLDLAGRVFLHDYVWQDDTDFATLTLILTAPMVVAHWINMQYYASTVDNRRFGSGNKVLHNVVGGNVGVFEGNGGDLRIGLALQSVHDGERWRHTPLRLSVFVEAPQEAIDDVLAHHAVVRQLVDHTWVHLFQIDADGRTSARTPFGGWTPAPRPTASRGYPLCQRG